MKKLKSDLLYSVAYQILAIVLPLFTAPYIARVLSPSGVGMFTYTNSVANYFILLGMLGMTNLGNRCIAEVVEDINIRSQRFSDLYFLQFCSFLVSIVVYICYIILCVKKYILLSIIQIIYILGGMFDIGWFFAGIGQIKITIVRNAIIKIFTVILVFVFVKEQSDVWIYTLIMALGTFGSQIYLWGIVKKYIQWNKPSISRMKQYIKPLLIYFVPVISYSIYKLMDKVMLGIMAPIQEIGYYENALKIVNVPMSIINAFGVIMLSRITVMRSEGNHVGVKQYINVSIKLVTILSSVICFGLMGVSKLFTVWYYGKKFLKTGYLIEMLAITCLFVAWASVLRTQFLIPYKKDAIYMWSTVAGALVNIVINFLLIPTKGSIGAACGTIIAEFIVMFVQFYCIRKEILGFRYIWQSIPYIVNGFIMLLVVRIVDNYVTQDIYGLIIEIIVGGLIYIFLSIIVVFIVRDELYSILIGKKLANLINLKK